MAFNVKTGTFTSIAGSGNQSVTGVGFQPKALILFGTNVDGLTTTASQIIGMTDGTNEARLHARSEHSSAISNGALGHSTSQIFGFVDANGGSAGRNASFSSFDSDGFTITWSASGAQFPIHYIAIGGEELTDVDLSTRLVPASTGNQEYDSLSFQPDALLAFGGSHTSAVLGRNTDPLSWFFGATDGTNEWVIASTNDEDSDPTNTYRLCRNDRFIATLDGSTGAVHNQASLVSLDSDGFTLNWDTVNSQDAFFVLALKGGSYKAGVETAKSTTGTKGTTGVGFEPAGLILQAAGITPSSTVTDHVSRSLGAGDGTTDVVSSYTDEHDVTTTITKRYMKSTELLNYRSNDGTSTLDSATISSLDADGFTLNWGTVDGNERSFLYFALGSSGISEAASTLNLTQDLDVLKSVAKSASSALSLTDSATGTGATVLDASSSLSITDEAIASGPITTSASSPLSLSQLAELAEEIDASADNSLVLSQQAVSSGPKQASAENSLTLISLADTPEKLRAVTSQLLLVQDVVHAVSKLAKNQILLTQAANRELIGSGISQLLDLDHRASIPDSAENELSLTHSADFEPFVQARLVKSKLSFSQSAVAGGTLGKAGISDLLLSQAVAVIHQRQGAACLGLMIAPDDPLFTQGVKLSGVGEWTSPRSMNLDDIDRIQSDRINRESRGGTLLVFADSLWPQTETLLYSVSGIKRPVAHDLLDFLSDNLGTPVTLTTHEGHQWTGLVINPDAAVVEDRRGSFTVQLEFEGTEV